MHKQYAMNQSTHATSTGLDASRERLRLWIRLLKTTRMIEAELRERLRVEYSCTLPRFDVMSALSRRQEGLKMSELSRMLMVSNGNVTGIVERLAEDGLLIREAVPGDRRAARVRLTHTGLEEFAKQAKAHQGWLDEIMGTLDAQDCVQITDMLNAGMGQHEKE